MSVERIGVPSAEYHSIQRLSQSKLKRFMRDPREYHAQWIAMSEPDPEVRKYQKFGLDLEHLLFTGDINAVEIPPDVLSKRTTTDGKVSLVKSGKPWTDWKAEQIQLHGDDVQLLKPDEYTRDILPLLTARDNVRAHEYASAFMFGGSEIIRHPQILFDWGGFECKCELDIVRDLGNGQQVIVDLKSTKDPDPVRFNRDISEYGYHIQGAWYQRAWFEYTKATTGVGHNAGFAIVAVKNAKHWTCEAFYLSPEWLQIGAHEIELALQDLRRAYETDNWETITHNTLVTLEPYRYHKAYRTLY